MTLNRKHNHSTKYWKYKIVHLIGLVILLYLMSLSSSFTSPALAYDPHFRLPWAPGATYGISGSRYGEGLHTGTDYYAIDFGVPNTHEVRASQGGYATTFPNSPTTYGNYIVIDHGNGFTTRYAHLSTILISNGVNVTQGQLIGRAGDSGIPGQFHLHFVARFNGQAYMPEPMSGYTGFGNSANPNSYTNNPQPANVIQNGDLWTSPVMVENGGVWQRSTGVNYSNIYCCGPDGNNYLATDPGVLGSGSIWQDFPVRDTDWSNHTQYRTFINTPDTWTVRAWMRSNCGTAYGTVAIWALNGPPQEAGSTPIVLNGAWQAVTATARFASNGHNRFRVIFYMDSAGCSYDFDNVTLQRNYLNNSSLEDNGQNWGLYHESWCQANWAFYTSSDFPNAPARDDVKFVETNRGTCTTGWVSSYGDAPMYTIAGQKYYARAWLRRREGSNGGGLWVNLSMQELAIWPTRTESWHYIPNGDYNWREITVERVLTYTGYNPLRIEFTIYDTCCQFNYDGVQLWGPQ
jgi:hypothetical protein